MRTAHPAPQQPSGMPFGKYVPFLDTVDTSLPDRTWPDRRITAAPRWLSTDLRDGNQSLIEPMGPTAKRAIFDLLVRMGFKEIEVGFPAASQTDYDFVRSLVDDDAIPADVTISVLTQSRGDLIDRTLDACVGMPRATVHLYNALSPLFRGIVFRMGRDDIRELAVDGTRQVMARAEKVLTEETVFGFEYSPEIFVDTERDYALEVCEAVMDVWQPEDDREIILNLPATVERATPNVYADQIEWMSRNLPHREHVCLSLHNHNDRGSGVAAAELGLLAGADRVEGCLFGHGERTGNVDLVTLGMNLYSQGVDPQIDFSDMDRIRRTVEYCTGMPVPARQPYAGDLVYTAFSGSHQDAIKKGFDARQPGDPWQMPYLPIDPQDIGCSYEAVIRVNSQSGKSGSAWLIEQNHGLKLPRGLQQDFSQHVQQATDSDGKEMTHHALWQLFRTRYGLQAQPALTLLDYQSASQQDGQLSLQATLRHHGETRRLQGQGNGLLSAAASGLSALFRQPFMIKDYHEHTLGARSDSRSVAHIRCVFPQGESYWGVGIDNDVARASLQARVTVARILYD